MPDTMRVILVEPNRYHALLVERQIYQHFPDALVVRYDSGGPAIEELSQASYHALITSLDVDHDQGEEFIRYVRQSDAVIAVLALASDNGDADSPDDVYAHLADSYISKKGNFSEEVARELKRLLAASQFVPGVQHGSKRPHTATKVAGLMVNTLAHEINNPLMTILGTAELMIAGADLNDDQRDKLDMIYDSAQRIRTLLDDLQQAEHYSVRSTASGYLIDRRRSADLAFAP